MNGKLVLEHGKLVLEHGKLVLEHDKLALEHGKLALEHDKPACAVQRFPQVNHHELVWGIQTQDDHSDGWHELLVAP